MAYKYWGTGGVGYGTGVPPALEPGAVFVSTDMVALYVGPAGGGAPTPVGGTAFPPGGIILWSGLLTAIPTGWNLCDGTNGTPDLRDRFIVGAHAGDNPGATGGSNTHTHNDHTVTQPTISGSTAPGTAHTHTATWPVGVPAFNGTPFNAIINHTHPIVDPGHTHVQNSFAPRIINSGTAGTVGVQGASAASNANASNAATTATNQTASTGITTTNPVGGVATITPAGTIAWPVAVPINATESAHTHPVGTLAATGTATSAHSTANNVPVYFALAFLMKAA